MRTVGSPVAIIENIKHIFIACGKIATTDFVTRQDLYSILLDTKGWTHYVGKNSKVLGGFHAEEIHAS